MVVVMTVGPHQDDTNWILWVATFWFPIMKFELIISWSYNFEIPVQDSDTGNLSPVTVRMEYLIDFQFW